MTHEPFATNHDADDLNGWLDDLVTGNQTPPATEIQNAAAQIHALASPPSPDTHRQQEEKRAMPSFLPQSRRRQQSCPTTPPPWYSMAVAGLVVALFVSMVGYAWLRTPGTGTNDDVAWAPQSLKLQGVVPLDSTSAPWIADFDADDCTETTDLQEVTIDYAVMPTDESQKYAVTGAASTVNAEAAARQYRAMRGCATLTSAWAYWTEARIYQHSRVINDTSRKELAQLQSYFATVYPEQFMAAATDLEVSDEIRAEWAARAENDIIAQPIPLAAKLNPKWAVSLSDGRVAFPATVVYSTSDPAIILGGLPIEHPADTVVIVFANVDGTWKYDDSLALCLANCASGVGNPLDPEVETWAQSADQRVCTAQPRSPGLNYDLSNGLPDYEDREYQVVAASSDATAQIIAQTANDWLGCSFVDTDSSETLSYLTPFGTANFVLVEQGSFGDPFVIAPYLREREAGTAELLSSVPTWGQVAVVDAPLRYERSGLTWTPMFDGISENTASVRTQDGAFNPTTAMTLSDHRVAIGYTLLVTMNDRGAITYEGNSQMNMHMGVVLQQHDDLWLIDDILVAQSGTFVFTSSDGWWWDAAFDPAPAPVLNENLAATPDASLAQDLSPLDPESAPWIADFVPEDCQGEYQSPGKISSRVANAEFGEQSYAIIGPANPGDAAKVGDAYRAMRGCDNGNNAASYWSDARVGAVPRDLTETNLTELADLQTHFQSVYPDQFMVTTVDVTVPNEVRAEWDARAEYDVLGAPIPLSVKINPEWGVNLGDGRIAFPATLVYAANDPAIVANGMPVDSPASTVAMVFTYENDGWKYDDSLPLCLANCAFGIGNPVDPAWNPWVFPPTIAECTASPVDSATIRERMNADIDWTADSITIQGPAVKADAEEALATYRILDACTQYNLSAESYSVLSDQALRDSSSIWGIRQPITEQDRAKQEEIDHQNALLRMQLAVHEPRISNLAVSQFYLGRYAIPGAMSPGQTLGNNDDAWVGTDVQATANGALLLEDGRIILPQVTTVDMNDRGAIRYGGNIRDRGSVVILRNVDGEWKVDAVAPLSYDGSIVPLSGTWWYDTSSNAILEPTPVATPAS